MKFFFFVLLLHFLTALPLLPLPVLLRQETSSCPCFKKPICPTCPNLPSLKGLVFSPKENNFNKDCPCAPKVKCPPCLNAKTQKFIHEEARKEAQRHALTQETLSKEAQLQAKLFNLAVKFAKEAGEQEELARKAAIALQQASSKAQIARNKMKRATTQARLLAMKAITTISDSKLDTNTPTEITKPMDLETPESLEEAVTNNELEGSGNVND